MRVLIDDISHTVTTYETVEVDGQHVEITKGYIRRQPEIEHTERKVTIKGFPRLGSRLKVVVDGDEFEGQMLEGYGAQDVLAQIGSKIHFDDTSRTAELDTNDSDHYSLIVYGGKIDSIEAVDFEHEPLPARVEEILNRHISGYRKG